MGVSLYRPDHEGHWHSTHIFWNRVLQLARDYGWEPTGTGPPADWDSDSGADWSGSYQTNHLQAVSATDGSNLVAALDAVMDDIPDHDVADAAPATVFHTGGDPIAAMRQMLNPPPTNLLKFFAGQRKMKLKELVGFCRQGRFVIG